MIKETLKMPRAFVADHLVLQISKSTESQVLDSGDLEIAENKSMSGGEGEHDAGLRCA